MPRHPGLADDAAMATIAGAHREYEIRVIGPVRADVLSRLGIVASVEPADTALRGSVPDLCALHGMLARLELLGLELVDVRRLP
jgi:hypothetical protein